MLEDGAVAFDLREARYSLSGQHGKCLLHLWSQERNLVRRVLEVERARDSLRLSVLRFGQTRPTRLEFCRSRDRRTTASKQTARTQYKSLLTRLIGREFPAHKLDQLISSTDLKRHGDALHPLRRACPERWLESLVLRDVTALDARLTYWPRRASAGWR